MPEKSTKRPVLDDHCDYVYITVISKVGTQNCNGCTGYIFRLD